MRGVWSGNGRGGKDDAACSQREDVSSEEGAPAGPLEGRDYATELTSDAATETGGQGAVVALASGFFGAR